MHPEAIRFVQYVKKSLPDFFISAVRVLDVGSGDINGNNSYLFGQETKYEGNDMTAGKNVTIVSPTSKLTFDEGHFDIIVSTECFEHDPEYELSMKNIARMCKPGGIFFFTCASTGRPEHGTRRVAQWASFASLGGVDAWQDYYKNLTFEDISFLTEFFPFSRTYYNEHSKDLYYIGFKSPVPEINLNDYVDDHVTRTS